ncbi:MAG: histidine kinase dimerization/phospho-acceptor domain-containing protein [Verrucomicrobiales bacterium]
MLPPPDSADFSRIHHDVRTPVNHILGYAEMLLEDATLPGEFREDVGRIHAGGLVLLGLIKDYFDDERFAEKRPDAHRMYHELRAPVNHIIGYTELLCELADDRGLSDLRADLTKIDHGAKMWLTLMEEYLLTPERPRVATAPATMPGLRYDVSPADCDSATRALRGKLLVVDDDVSNRDMLTRRLQRLGHTVDTASSGAEALQKLRAAQFDIILLDLVMPGLDG